MKRLLHLFIITTFLIAASAASAKAQNRQGKAQRTSGAQAAYGNSVMFKSHVKKNKKAKRRGLKAVERKKLRDSREPYRRGIPI
jgi:Ni/Co efflux regulator RcnB